MDRGHPKGDSRRAKENSQVFDRTDRSNWVALPERRWPPGRGLGRGWRSSFCSSREELRCSPILRGRAELFVRFFPGLAQHGRAREGRGSLISGYFILGFFSGFIPVKDFMCFIQEPSTAGHCQSINHQGSSALIKLPARNGEHRTDQYIMWESSANHLLTQCLTACLQK